MSKYGDFLKKSPNLATLMDFFHKNPLDELQLMILYFAVAVLFISIFFFCRRKEVFAEKSHLTLKNHIFPKNSQSSKKLSQTKSLASMVQPISLVLNSKEFFKLQVYGRHPVSYWMQQHLCKTLLLEEDTNVGGIPDSFSKKDRAGNDLIYQALHQLFSKIKELVR